MDAVHPSPSNSKTALQDVVAQVRRPVVLALGTAALVTAANGTQGAYFSQSWGWVSLAFLVPTSVALILGRSSVPDRLRLIFLGLVLALASWTALSALWSLSTPGSLREVERMVVYGSLALAVAFFLRAGDGPPVLAGLYVGTSVICAYALATRLLPDRIVTHDDPSLENRLGQPLGYPNGLGALAALGVLLALGIIAHGGRRSAIAAAVALPVVVGTLYFTFSRGAWAALVLSYVVALLLDARWLRSLWMTPLVALPSGVFVLLASREDALTSSEAHVRRAAAEGHRLVPVLLIVMALSGVLAWGAHTIARRVVVPARVSRFAGLVVICSALAAAAVVLVAVGGPAEGASRLRASFESFHIGAPTNDLNSRLFEVYGTGRAEIWPVAWDDFKLAPIVGNGAGSFEYSWYELRPSTRITRDAHSLYLESLDELGLVGFLLVVGMLALPLVAIVARRRSRFVPYAGAAYVSWGVACAADWHWEMTGLSITALLAGSIGFLARSDAGGATYLEGRARAVLLALAIAFSAFAVVDLVGNQALSASQEEVARGEWSKAHENARVAARLLPWSFEPDLALGDAEAGLGDRTDALRAYRDATAKDPRNWGAWLRLAQVARGAERARAYARVHALNPREPELPGEKQASG